MFSFLFVYNLTFISYILSTQNIQNFSYHDLSRLVSCCGVGSGGWVGCGDCCGGDDVYCCNCLGVDGDLHCGSSCCGGKYC